MIIPSNCQYFFGQIIDTIKVMKVFYSNILDPAMNLSIENWLLKREDLKNFEVLFFYRNSPSVIIGRSQNPWLECDLQKMAENKVPLVRRESGGGAVYHDPGNMNFSFISEKEKLVKEERTVIIIKALRSLSISAVQGERNDIYIDGRKISGSAGRYTSSRALHHGTLLIDADLNALNKYLIAKDYKSSTVQSRGIASIRSEVANIGEFNESVDYLEICNAIIKESTVFLNSPAEATTLEYSDLEGIREIRENYIKLTGWDWLYGKTPSFTISARVMLSGIERECRFSINKGIVDKVDFEGETIAEKDKKHMVRYYLGKRFSFS